MASSAASDFSIPGKEPDLDRLRRSVEAVAVMDGIKPRILQTAFALHGVEVVADAVSRLSARIEDGEDIRSPGVLLPRVCGDVQRERAAGKREPSHEERIDAHFREQARREGRVYMGRG